MKHHEILSGFCNVYIDIASPVLIFASITPLKQENIVKRQEPFRSTQVVTLGLPTKTPVKKATAKKSPTPKQSPTSTPTPIAIITKTPVPSLTSVPVSGQTNLSSLSPIILLGIALTLIIGLIILFVQFRSHQGNTENLIRESQTEITIIKEKLSHLEPVTQAVGDVRTEVRGLVEKTSTVERNQTVIQKSSEDLVALKTLADGLVQTTQSIRDQLEQAKSDLAKLQTNAEARQDVEQQIAGSVRRLGTVIAGTHSKGSAGESILEAAFAKLPIEWQVRNFTVNGKSVEFGLKLPNNLILPNGLDSF